LPRKLIATQSTLMKGYGKYNMAGKYDLFGEDADLDFGQNDQTTSEYYDPFKESIAGFDAQLEKLTPGTEEYNLVYSQKAAIEALQTQRPVGPKRQFKRPGK